MTHFLTLLSKLAAMPGARWIASLLVLVLAFFLLRGRGLHDHRDQGYMSIDRPGRYRTFDGYTVLVERLAPFRPVLRLEVLDADGRSVIRSDRNFTGIMRWEVYQTNTGSFYLRSSDIGTCIWRKDSSGNYVGIWPMLYDPLPEDCPGPIREYVQKWRSRIPPPTPTPSPIPTGT